MAVLTTVLRTNFKQRAASAFLQMSARFVLTQLRFVNVSQVVAVKFAVKLFMV